eukprot:2914104-Karenia_brevis.AAC.1
MAALKLITCRYKNSGILPDLHARRDGRIKADHIMSKLRMPVPDLQAHWGGRIETEEIAYNLPCATGTVS